jgi:putative sigma-54 modulation protein
MHIAVNGRHLEITPAIKNYSEEKISKFEKYLPEGAEAIVTLSIEKYRHKAEVLLKTNGVLIQAESITGEIYSAIDEVSEKLDRQVKKYKEKHSSYRKGGATRTPETHGKAPAAQESGRIIKNKRHELKPMSPEEAAMQMELLDKDFFVFINDKSSQVNVIYQRKDGNFGLIEPVK